MNVVRNKILIETQYSRKYHLEVKTPVHEAFHVSYLPNF